MCKQQVQLLMVDVQQIPADHLEGLYIWNHEDIEPIHTVYTAGSGLINIDYILYIQSTYTTTCLQGVSIVLLCVCVCLRL